jgi:hypothetical protein
MRLYIQQEDQVDTWFFVYILGINSDGSAWFLICTALYHNIIWCAICIITGSVSFRYVESSWIRKITTWKLCDCKSQIQESCPIHLRIRADRAEVFVPFYFETWRVECSSQVVAQYDVKWDPHVLKFCQIKIHSARGRVDRSINVAAYQSTHEEVIFKEYLRGF